MALSSSLSDPSRKRTTKSRIPADPDHDSRKRRKTFTDFFTFCNFVLAYEEQLAKDRLKVNQAEEDGEEDGGGGGGGGISKPLVSGPDNGGEGSAGESPHHSSSSSSSSSDSSEEGSSSGDNLGSSESGSNEQLQYTSDDESWNAVTCFCGRPFAGRPMIECSQCFTWIHLYCAKIRKSNVPEVYTCQKCRSKGSGSMKKRKSRDPQDPAP